MSGFFRKLLGIVLLLATISLSTCQSLIYTISEHPKSLNIENKGDL